MGNTRVETGANIVAGNYGNIDITHRSTLDGKFYTFSGIDIGTVSITAGKTGSDFSINGFLICEIAV